MALDRRGMLKGLGAVGAAAAGCLGDGGGDPGPTRTDTATPTDTATATATGAQARFPDYNWDRLADASAVATATVTMTGFQFSPLVATMPPGTELTVLNDDGADHTFTAPALGVDVTLSGGETTTLTVSETGTYDYVCEFHPPDMLGRLVVDDDVTLATETPTDTPTRTPTDTPTRTPTPSPTDSPTPTPTDSPTPTPTPTDEPTDTPTETDDGYY